MPVVALLRTIAKSPAARRFRRDGGPPDNGEMKPTHAKPQAIAEMTSELLATLVRDTAAMQSNIATREDLHQAMNEQAWKILGAAISAGTLLPGMVYLLAPSVA